MSIIATPSFTISPVVTGGDADPTQLPAATGQTKNTTAYTALGVPAMAAGGSYTDPTTGVKVWKMTSASVPSATQWGQDYNSGGQKISQPWTGVGGYTYWTIYFTNYLSTAHWLVDFCKETGFSNYRQLTGSIKPAIDLCFAFSANPATPHIAYVIASGINRIDTTAGVMALANTGYFPKSGGSDWLQGDMNDVWFVAETGGQGSGNFMAWNSQTNASYTRSGANEGRLERNGTYVLMTNVSSGWLWRLADNTVWPSGSFGSQAFCAHGGECRNYWMANYSNNEGGNGIDVYYPDEAAANGVGRYSLVYPTSIASTGIIARICGHWIQTVGDRTQWLVYNDQSGSGSSGSIRQAIALVRCDGATARLMCHHYSTTTSYYQWPAPNISPDGKLVIFCSNMNGQSRTDDFLAEMPLS
jgi:hypothetical protein